MTHRFTASDRTSPRMRVRRFTNSLGTALALLLMAMMPSAVAQPAPSTSNSPSTTPVESPTPPTLPSLGAPPLSPAATSPVEPARSLGDPPAPLVVLPRDLSPWAIFMNADIVVKAVMVGLAFASLVTWTIWLAKSLQLVGARHRAVAAVGALLEAESLADLKGRGQTHAVAGGPVAALVHAAEHERDRSADLPPDGVKERVAIALGRVEARAARLMTRGTGLVATIGSTAPFVGLFGTVWGIMNAFVGITQAHTTNLAVVAPGIAEALLATAIGLVAAIPAVVIYNQFARSIAGYKALLSDASTEVMRHLSRDLDRQHACQA